MLEPVKDATTSVESGESTKQSLPIEKCPIEKCPSCLNSVDTWLFYCCELPRGHGVNHQKSVGGKWQIVISWKDKENV